MSPDDKFLFSFSVVFSIAMFLAVLVPYLRGKRDLFCFWNLFLFGSGIFVGFSGLNSVTRGHYFQYSNSVFTYFYTGLAAFYITLFLTYRYLKMPRHLAGRWLTTWPHFSSGTLYALTIISLILALGQLAISFVPGFTQMSVRVGAIAPIFALTFALANWYQNRTDPFRLVLLLFVLALAAFSAFSYGGGRRLLYGTLGVVPLCLYWWKLRYMKPWKVVLLFALLLVPFAAFDQAYRAVRFHGVRWGTKSKLTRSEGAKTRISMLKSAWSDIQTVEFARIGQKPVEASLISIQAHVVDPGSHPWAKVRPLYSFYVGATMPFPRALWPDKPKNIGLTLPFDSGALRKGQRTNWGVGVVGIGYRDGGIPALILYGFLAAFVLRFLDEVLLKNPGNPLLLGFFATASGHVILWPRGVISQISMWIFACFLVMILLRTVAHLFVGKRRPDRLPAQPIAVNGYQPYQGQPGRNY